MPDFLTPNSWGVLREDNYCHLPDGRLAPKGQGNCTGGPPSRADLKGGEVVSKTANYRPARAGANVAAVNDECSVSAEEDLFDGRSAESVAKEMIAGVDHTKFTINISSEGGDGPDRDSVRDEYDSYVERAEEQASDQNYREWESEHRDAVSKLDTTMVDVQRVFDEEAEAAFHGEQGRLFSAHPPTTMQFVDELMEKLDEIQGGLGAGLTEEHEAALREWLRSHPYLKAQTEEAARLPVVRTEEYIDVFDKELGDYDTWRESHEPDTSEILSFDGWYEDHYGNESGDPPRIRINFSGRDGTDITREFYRNGDGEFEVHHDYFEADDSAPPGTGKRLFYRSVQQYERLGVDKITTYANISTGSYAWPRYGFVADSPSGVARMLENRLARYIDAGEISYKDTKYVNGQRTDVFVTKPMTKEISGQIQSLIDRYRRDEKIVWHMADMRIGDFNVGKAMLWQMSYDAHLDLNDSEHVTRMKRYIASGRS